MMSLHFNGLCYWGREQKQRWNSFVQVSPQKQSVLFFKMSNWRVKVAGFGLQGAGFLLRASVFTPLSIRIPTSLLLLLKLFVYNLLVRFVWWHNLFCFYLHLALLHPVIQQLLAAAARYQAFFAFFLLFFKPPLPIALGIFDIEWREERWWIIFLSLSLLKN